MLPRFKCERLSAKISLRQCVRNYKRVKGLDSVIFLKSAGGTAPQWGLYGKSHYLPAVAMNCQGCPIGEKAERRMKSVLPIQSESSHNLRSTLDRGHKRPTTPSADYAAEARGIREDLRRAHELCACRSSRMESLPFRFGYEDGVSEGE